MPQTRPMTHSLHWILTSKDVWVKGWTRFQAEICLFCFCLFSLWNFVLRGRLQGQSKWGEGVCEGSWCLEWNLQRFNKKKNEKIPGKKFDENISSKVKRSFPVSEYPTYKIVSSRATFRIDFCFTPSLTVFHFQIVTMQFWLTMTA